MKMADLFNFYKVIFKSLIFEVKLKKLKKNFKLIFFCPEYHRWSYLDKRFCGPWIGNEIEFCVILYKRKIGQTSYFLK